MQGEILKFSRFNVITGKVFFLHICILAKRFTEKVNSFLLLWSITLKDKRIRYMFKIQHEAFFTGSTRKLIFFGQKSRKNLKILKPLFLQNGFLILSRHGILGKTYFLPAIGSSWLNGETAGKEFVFPQSTMP